MKIGFDAKRLFKNFTGLGNYSRTLVKNLQTFFPENEYVLYTPGVNKFKQTQSFLDPSRFSIVQPEKKLYPLWRTFGLNKQIIKDGLDIYHGLSHELPLGKKNTVRTVVTIHDVIQDIYPSQYSRVNRNIYRQKLKYAIEKSDRIFVISNSTASDIKRIYKADSRKIRITHQSVDEIFFEPIKAQMIDKISKKYNLPAKYILYVGSVIERKNLLNLMKAYEKIQKNYEIPLVVIGEGGKYFTKVKKFVSEKKIEKSVRFLSNTVDFKDLPGVYMNAEFLVYPSEYEGFGLPVIEAMASGCPVITGNNSSLVEVGGEAALFCEPSDFHDISEKLENLLQNQSLRLHMKEKGILQAQKFSPEIITKNIYDEYIDLLES